MKKFMTAFLLLTLALPAFSADAVLQSVRGKVQIKTGGVAAYEARKGDPLFFGDDIKTEKGALAHVVFKDGTAVLLKEGSSLSVKGKKGDTLLSFSVGEFLIGLKRKLAAGEKFRVRTPAAVAAVRGTLFWGLSDPATKDTTYACFESKIEITAQGRSVMLEPGQKVKIPFGKAPDAVASAADIPADYVNTFKLDDSLQGLEQLMSVPAEPVKTEEAPVEPAPAEPVPASTPTAPAEGQTQP
jgi:hypothetical protein